MFVKSPLRMAIASLLIAPVCAQAEVEVSAELKNETAFFTKSGQVTGKPVSMLDNREHDAGDLMKFENSARIFINGDVGDSSTWHVELRPVYDTEGVNGYQGHKSYTQNDYLREAYIDTKVSDWYLRLGKQQVVWGTADGIKLLDIINPTDFRELNQNAVEDARIPVWMVNAERNFDNGGNLQLIVSQAEENKYPGLDPNGDSGQPFIAKGVDTISGQVNGFYAIAPALSNVAATFNGAAMNGGFTGGVFNPAGLTPFGGLTVDGFASSSWNITTPGQLNPGAGAPDPSLTDPTNMPGYVLLNNFAQNGFTGQPGFPVGVVDPNGNNNTTNLLNVTGPNFGQVVWNPAASTSAFEYMSNATFATFNSFTGFNPANPTGLGGIQTSWERDYSEKPNFGGRYRGSFENGLNYSLNYFYHASANPIIDLSWRNAAGETLTVQRAPTINPAPGAFVPDASQDLTRAQARANHDLGSPTTILLHDAAGNYYGALDPTLMNGTPGAGAPTLHFTEKAERVHSFGTSFDYALDAGSLPIVLRGEFLYDKGERQPVVDKYLLSIGDLTNALKMEEADYFKYVLGADVTIFTNLLVSAQFIQFRNLDFVDQPDTCGTQGGRTMDCSRYTADFATLHLSNGLNRAEKNKEFYSLFLSKPIGESQLGRVNNIIIYEEGGGYWDRIDAEYSLTDQWILTGELNLYWGDENTTFGQFENSSNIQVGMKYIIE